MAEEVVIAISNFVFITVKSSYLGMVIRKEHDWALGRCARDSPFSKT